MRGRESMTDNFSLFEGEAKKNPRKTAYQSLKQRRENFVASLSSYEGAELWSLCQKELDFLKERQANPNSLKAYISQYRTLMRMLYGHDYPALAFFNFKNLPDGQGEEATSYTKPPSRQFLVEAFADKLVRLSNEEKCRALWEEEFNSLHNLSDKTKKLYLTRYYRPILKRRLGESHPIFQFISLPKEVGDKIKNAYRKQVAEQHQKLILIEKWQEIRQKSEDILLEIITSGNLSDAAMVRLGAVLLLLTGRRPYEIFCSCDFSPIRVMQKNIWVTPKWNIFFEGQAKTRQKPGTKYEMRLEIPILTQSKNILKAITMLRDSPLGKRLLGISNPYFTKLLNSRGKEEAVFLRYEVLKIYGSLWSEEEILSPKNLRALYAEIAYKIFLVPMGIRESKNSYFSRILGHSLGDLTTSHSYMRYNLGDGLQTEKERERTQKRLKEQLEKWENKRDPL